MAISGDAVEFSGIDEAGVAALARQLAPQVRQGGVIHLVGPLGAGKTTFARALLQTLGVGPRIKSPTYSLIESYAGGGFSAHHLDLYRVAAAEEVEWLGLRDLAEGNPLWLIEWPERATGAIPAADLVIEFQYAPAARNIRLRAVTPLARQWLHSCEKQQQVS
jgi:tRNA threonylcarbamoyladenosine biosynthesis protein TsaE